MVYSLQKHLNSRERLILMQNTLRMMLKKSRSKISYHYFGIKLVQHQQRLRILYLGQEGFVYYQTFEGSQRKQDQQSK
ncbi:unnamed protein product [Paramecium primaurelia]|uniref:Uncharacterized protein n=1 Tax=Paramecium primaurelia TaxID=5886 RepID=A0A8S1QQL3_PARPR|nr:unnamed protein product [Paramecium primaurelia]